MFNYLDQDGGGSVGYLEFTKLTDEKRMGLDPFANQAAHVKMKYDINDLDNSNPVSKTGKDEMEVFNKQHNVFDKEKFKGKNANHILEVKADLKECISQKQQDYKFREL